MSVKMRQLVEREIVDQVVDSLLEAGYLLGVNDGEEVTIHNSRDTAKVKAALMTTDEDYLLVYVDRDQDDPLNVEPAEPDEYNLWVRLIYGNDGWDVINDYHIGLEPVIGKGTKVDQLIEKYAD